MASRRQVVRWCAALAGLSLIPFAFGWLGWMLELGRTFTLHFLMGSLACAAVSAALRRPRVTLFCGVATIVHAGVIISGLRPAAEAPGPGALRLLVANVRTGNRDIRAVGRLIQRFNPDVVGLLEVNERWVEGIQHYVRGYATRLELPERHNFGIAAYARSGVATLSAPKLGEVHTIRAELSGLGGAAVYLTHVLPPISTESVRTRNTHLAAIAQDITKRKRPSAVVGDLNATPYESVFRSLRDQARLARAGGLAGSWPAGLPAPLRVPIDHVLVTEGLGAEVEYGPAVGSDHLPLLVRLGSRR